MTLFPRCRPGRRPSGKVVALLSLGALVLGSGLAPTAASAAGPNRLDQPRAVQAGSPGIPTAAAQRAGVLPGQGAPMGWSRPAATDPTALAASGTGPKVLPWFVPGLDASNYTSSSFPWASYAAAGYRFAVIKATESTTYANPAFAAQRTAARAAGMIQGTYHFANLRSTGGAAQADFYVKRGGGWSADGKTLPGVLDIEYDPYSTNPCWGLTPAAIVSWVAAFDARYQALTGVHPIIYTTADWWATCAGGSKAFAATNPIWIASWASTPGPLPAGWTSWTLWQSGADDPLGIDYNAFHGTYEQLQQLAGSAHHPYALQLAGADRTITSVAIARRQFVGPFPSGSGSVYLARSDILVDAMSAGSLTDGPVLLVPPCNGVPAAVSAEIARLAPRRVVALGSSDAVCDATLAAAAAGRTSSRLGGADRISTSVAIAMARAAQSRVTTIYLANSSESAPDAIVGGQLSDGPVVLVPRTGSAPTIVKSLVNTLQPRMVMALGGTAAVADSVLSSAAGTRSMGRLAGADRYDTAAQIAARAFPAGASVSYLASGQSFADAVAAGSLSDGALLLVPACAALPAGTVSGLTAARSQTLVPLGGTNAVCEQVVSDARAATG